ATAAGSLLPRPNGVRGAGIPFHVLPPSVVRTIDVHGGDAHGAVPSTQPFDGDTNVALAARNPDGTGPPGGPWKTVDGGAATGFGAADATVVGAVVGLGAGTAVVGAGGRPVIRSAWCLPPRRASGTATAAMSTAAATGSAIRRIRRARRCPATFSSIP